jgi:hypothetical protein
MNGDMSTTARPSHTTITALVVTAALVGLLISTALGSDLSAADLALRVLLPGLLAGAAARLLGGSTTNSQLAWVVIAAAALGALVAAAQLIWLATHFPFS